MHTPSLRASAFALLAAVSTIAAPDDGLRDYRPVAEAITTTIRKPATDRAGAVPYLGLRLATGDGGALEVGDVDEASPAAKAGFRRGDVIVEAGGKPAGAVAGFRGWLHSCATGETVAFSIRRDGTATQLTATLGAPSRPLTASEERGYVGLSYSEPDDRGAVITNVVAKSPAEKAGVQKDDILTKVGDAPMASFSTLSDVLTEKRPGDSLDLTFLHGEEERRVTLKLGKSANSSVSLASVLPSIWKRDTFRLAVIRVAFPDTPLNPQINSASWDEALFSSGTYRDKQSPTGQRVHGSFADFYRENSCGRFSVGGKVFEPVEVAKKRVDYAGSTRDADKSAFLSEVLDKLLEREGPDALKDVDGLIFIYAGERFPKANRGTLFWPHRATFLRAGKRWSYYICPEGRPTMTSISVFCHEFGHMLGLPDLYARPENPGSEGVGVWCLMSNERGGGKPQHMSAWCKTQLGWLQPVAIDPGVPQKLILGPVEGSTTECVKVLLRPDGAEYLLLENRRRSGFDTSLPAEGLLIWHIVGRRPILEESHGIEGPLGPRVFLGSVPYPSKSNTAFTPYTTPSSRSQLGGGAPVHLTNIRQLPDGRVSFQIGYEYQ